MRVKASLIQRAVVARDFAFVDDAFGSPDPRGASMHRCQRLRHSRALPPARQFSFSAASTISRKHRVKS